MNDSETNNPENNDPEISDNLRRIVPDDLSPAGLVAGTRGKRRRRKGVVGVLTAIALVAVAVPVALNLPTNNSLVAEPAVTSTASRGEAPEAGSVLPGAQACYNDDGTPVNHSQDASGSAETGAVKAWLCGDYSPETGAGYVGPIEPLTLGIDGLLEGVQSEPEVDLAVISCPAEYNLSFNVVFEYEDGARSIVGGDRHGCSTTYDGGVVREGGEKFYGALITAWQIQRETDTGDWLTPTICPGPLPLIPTGGNAVQGAICAEDVDGSGGRSAAYLDEELLKWVEGAAFSRPENLDWTPPTSTAPEQRYWITLSNEFSDHTTFVRHEDGLFGARDGDGNEWFWAPEPELAARLDEALAGAAPSDVPPAGQPLDPTGMDGPVQTAEPEPTTGVPEPWVAPGCRGVSLEEVTSTNLPEGEVPGTPGSVWLCASGEARLGAPTPPLEPLKEPHLISQAVAAFNELSTLPADKPCTMELGPSYMVVYEYPRGARLAVEVQDYGCRGVVAGDVVKEGGEVFKEVLLDVWSTQRSLLQEQPSRQGPLCQLASSMFDLRPEEVTFAEGVACTGFSGADNVDDLTGEEVQLPADLVQQVAEQMVSVPLEPVQFQPDGDSLVLMTTAGDPFVLSHQEDGTFHWLDGDYARAFTPIDEAAEALAALFEK